MFVSALEGNPVTITHDNFKGLSQLCDEFRFQDLAERLSQFRMSDDLRQQVTVENLEVQKRLSALEERMQQFDCQISDLQRELSQPSEVQESVLAAFLERVERLEAEVSALKAAPIPAQTTPPARDSVIMSDLPEIFAEFRGQRFSLLWRGGRDGFGARDFHNRCDGHPNTLTVILDTNGNIFGGFTPVQWESRDLNGKSGKENNCYKADPSLKSFVFTLKNPHNIAARIFALKAESADKAIWSDGYWGPIFGNEIGVSNDCNANTRSFISDFGCHYTNNTGLNGKTVFTSSGTFQVKEIEVFEITG
jgi:hypothetical protein